MRDPIRVLLLGTGQMGAGIARIALQKRGLQIVGAYARRSQRAGLDLGRVIGLERNLGIALHNDLEDLIERVRPHVALQATCSRLDDALGEVSMLVRHGIDVISIAEELSHPASRSQPIAEELGRLAREHSATVVGTGINPGFVFDLLIITLTGVCADVQSITATRVNDLSPYGPSVLNSQGVGLSPEAFANGLANGTVVGHIGFQQSIHMICRALGWEIDRIAETREPILSQSYRATPFIKVEPGDAAGCLHTALAYRDDTALITLVHPQQIHPGLAGVRTGDTIEISGTPNVRLDGSPEIPGGVATCALAVNMIPRVLNAAPGLYSMADLPVPAALLGDVRRLVHQAL